MAPTRAPRALDPQECNPYRRHLAAVTLSQMKAATGEQIPALGSLVERWRFPRRSHLGA